MNVVVLTMVFKVSLYLIVKLFSFFQVVPIEYRPLQVS